MKIWQFYYNNDFGWFRVFGNGLLWKNIEKHPLLFSERNNIKKGIQIGKWYIRFLRCHKT